jgi:hypothetical protein
VPGSHPGSEPLIAAALSQGTHSPTV